MTIREQIEERENAFLSPYAVKAAQSAGRERDEEPCDVRTCFQRDRDRILHCKSFRRLKDKTQVFLSPQGDHYRTRLMHTLEVAQIARTIGKALQLNEDLIEAIALGHDLGHTPFGHAGERALNTATPSGFRHNEQSLRVVSVLEKNGEGLNLTWEVRDGILNHKSALMPSTLEGRVVRLADKFAYIHHDTDDGERAGILTEEDFPADLRKLLGSGTRIRLNTMVHDCIESSAGTDTVRLSPAIEKAVRDMRAFMFERLYTNPAAKSEEGKAEDMVQKLYEYYILHPEEMSREYTELIASGEDLPRIACDYISGMTDQYARATFEAKFIPRAWEKY